ncbi:MAG: hypothetical protein Q9166_001950 [cf. Caloplaca sp. 2 TL-2023]
MESGPYSYKPLQGSRTIRLLHIINTCDENVPFAYDLATRDLDEHPILTALSYAWSSPIAQKDGLEGANRGFSASACTLQRLQHCHWSKSLTALTCVQQLKLSGYYWIDAICINQQNTKERNFQAAMMGDIYTDATQVTVWLGVEDPDFKIAMVFLDQFIPRLEMLSEERRQGVT